MVFLRDSLITGIVLKIYSTEQEFVTKQRHGKNVYFISVVLDIYYDQWKLEGHVILILYFYPYQRFSQANQMVYFCIGIGK